MKTRGLPVDSLIKLKLPHSLAPSGGKDSSWPPGMFPEPAVIRPVKSAAVQPAPVTSGEIEQTFHCAFIMTGQAQKLKFTIR